MADMGTKEASEKWKVTQRTVEKWCREGKITPQPTQDKKALHGIYKKTQYHQ